MSATTQQPARRRRVPADMAKAEVVQANVTADPGVAAAIGDAAVQQQAPGALSGPQTDRAGGARPRPSRTRKPFGSRGGKLVYPDREGYHRHWFNDTPGRLHEAEEAGYTQVFDANGKPVSYVVGVARGGGALTAYLHEIQLDWYQEDMAAQDQEVFDRLGQIQRGDFSKPGGDDGKLRYAGSTRGDISIRTDARR